MIHLPITRSQQMALIDVLVAYVRTPDSIETFVDCSTNPETTTSVGELLVLLTEAREVPTVSAQMLIDVGLNGFALELMSESMAGKKDVHTFKPLRFEYRGVIYTLEPAKGLEIKP
jgi:hypothetical protein